MIDYIAAENPLAAIELGDTIERRVADLPEHPRLYRAGRIRGTREMVVHPNYLVVYRIRRGEIEILRVLHSAQQWPLADAPVPETAANVLGKKHGRTGRRTARRVSRK